MRKSSQDEMVLGKLIPFPVQPKFGRSQVDFKQPGPSSGHGEILDMTLRRSEMLNQERRMVKRTILSEFIGAFVVVPEKGLQKVAVYDISEDGIAFDLDSEHGEFREGEQIAMRVYMNQSTYFPFVIEVHNKRFVADELITRHGGGFVRGTINTEALRHFVRFIESVSASLQTDHGDVLVTSARR